MNAIESVNARFRKAVRARGHFPNGAAAMRCVYCRDRKRSAAWCDGWVSAAVDVAQVS